MTVNAEAGFTPEEMLDSVRSGACEIGVLGSAQPTRASDLDVVELESQALVLISGPDDECPDGPTIRRDDLSGCRLIVSQRGSLMRALVDDVAGRRHRRDALSPKSPIALPFCRWSSTDSAVR